MFSAPLAQSFALLATSLVGVRQMDDADKERFLREAKIVSSVELKVGVTGSKRLTLELDGVTHDAHFQNISEIKPVQRFRDRVESNFIDSYRYNVAAYRLDRLLGMNMTPVSVERRIAGSLGAVTWWVDDVQMMELDRQARQIEPPDKRIWQRQMNTARLFHELIYNTDPNIGNVLIDSDWKVWLVDFTRAFRSRKEIQHPGYLIRRIDRQFWEGLKGLDEPTLRETMQGVLFNAEIRCLLARRDAMVAFVEKRIARDGEDAVFHGDSAPQTDPGQ